MISAVGSKSGAADRPNGNEWIFAQDGLTFSRDLEAARLSAVRRLAADYYELIVRPEKNPINPSAWYGFQIRAEQPKSVALELRYENGSHRYWPKLSRDGGVSWTPADPSRVSIDDGRLQLNLELDRRPVRVFAQPPLGPGDLGAWMADHVSKRGVETMTVGRSAHGRPLGAFAFGKQGNGAPLLILVGRQHPPETTGSHAMMAFVDTLLSDQPLAASFRERVRTIVFPMANPDGVVQGNWRGNANRVDLNRDWGPFLEPETRAIRDRIGHLVEIEGARPLFAIDFHSTFRDVLYTVQEDPSREPGGVLRRWIDGLMLFHAGRLEEQAFSASTAVFKNWVFNSYGISGVTYEVSDTTPPETLQQIAQRAAGLLMRLLLEEVTLPDEIQRDHHRLGLPALEPG